MKNISVLVILILIAVLAFSGCKAAGTGEPVQDTQEPVQEGKPPLTQKFTATINEVRVNELLVYAFIGYQGEVVVRLDEKTEIDQNLKTMIKEDNQITFTTDGMMTMSIPPQVVAVSIDAIIESVVFEGTVSEMSDDAVTVDTTYPNPDKLIARITPDTVFAEGLSENIEAGNTIRFETTGLMQPSEPAQMDVVRFTKNELPEAEIVKEVKEVRLGVVPEETGRIGANENWIANPDIYVGDSSSDGYVNSYISFDITDLAGAEIVSATLTMILGEEFGNREYLGNLEIGILDYGTGHLSASVGDISTKQLVQLPNSTTDIYYSSNDSKDELQNNINQGSDRFQLKVYWQNPYTNNDKYPDGLVYLKQDISLVVEYTK